MTFKAFINNRRDRSSFAGLVIMNIRRCEPIKVSRLKSEGNFVKVTLVAPERSVVVARTLGVGEVAGSIPAAPSLFSVEKPQIPFKPEKAQMRYILQLLFGHFFGHFCETVFLVHCFFLCFELFRQACFSFSSFLGIQRPETISLCASICLQDAPYLSWNCL